ncbi:acyl-CoA thioesterase domain-containing protein [Nocardioides campestrisoli]|uniref:acyl-CoA thioesterase domain-containing protein n=1 Tax=Nocardioides campestrisoli TaxID=2736757 RepID=UPI00163DC3F5|nr:acyl-CoA thioesterase domain-containing protein [Nocardioides campestrisoli]
MELAFFRLDGDRLVPLDLARSMWRDDQMHGLAVSGALGRAIEARGLAAGRSELVPARYTVDLFKAATMEPCHVETAVVRDGPRLLLIDAVLRQGGEPVARASAVLLRRTAVPDGEVWSPDDVPQPPPLEIAPDSDVPHIPFFHSDAGWSQDFGQHQNASRKQTWQTAVPVVLGEQATPFVAAASIADATSLVTNWGTEGVQYINTDITLSISRPPAGVQLGLLATDHHASDGVAVGSATVYDRQGPFGVATVTALANSRRTVDLSDGMTYQRGPKQ